MAEFLALDQIPEAWRPTPRVREHRTLIRQRAYVQKRITSVKNKLRHQLANYNADTKSLFSQAGRQCLAAIELSDADRFTVDLLGEELDQHAQRLKVVDRQLKIFAKSAPVAEREARAVLESIPCVGSVNKTRRWGDLYEKLKARCGAKKAIVAIARRVWCVMVYGLPLLRTRSGCCRRAGGFHGVGGVTFVLFEVFGECQRFVHRWGKAKRRPIEQMESM